MGDLRLKKKIAMGLLLVLVGIFILSNNFISEQREIVFNEMNLELSELLKKEEQEQAPQEAPSEEVKPEVETPPVNPEPVIDYESYIGVLDIPRIGFNRGFYAKESNLNNVKFNLKILDVSSYPDEDKGNVIIIGHSGNYSNSYFGSLYLLSVGDTASITYKDHKYNYQITNIYNDTKDGTVTIYRDEDKNCLTLITCTKDSDTEQTIYILERVSVE